LIYIDIIQDHQFDFGKPFGGIGIGPALGGMGIGIALGGGIGNGN